MSDATAVGEVLRVLVVGDSRAIDDAMDALSSRLESVSLLRERTLSSALERLARLEVHCVVCQFESTGTDRSSLESLRDREPALPIVAVTGEPSVDEATVERALEAGATDVVEPDDSRSLVATRVRNAAERHRLETSTDRRGRSVLDRSDAIVWLLDEAFEVDYASAAVESRMGYTPGELERTSLVRIVHPDDRETVEGTLEATSTATFGTTERVTARVGHADGTWHAYELTVTNRIADPALSGVVLTFSEPARDPADDVRSTLDRIADPFFSLGPEWELRYANEAASRLFVADASVEPGTVVWDLLDDDVRGTFYDRFREATATGRAVTFESMYPSLEGRLVVAVHPGEDGVTVHARETTEDGAAVDRERFALLESVVDALGDGLLVLEGGTVRYANARLAEFAADATVVGRELDAVFAADLAETIRERSRSPVVRWMDPVAGDVVAGSDDRPVDVFVTSLPGDDRTLCVVRDRRRSPAAALSVVEDTIPTIRDAETRPAVRQAVVDATLQCTSSELVGWYLVDGDALTPSTVETTGPDSPDELPSIPLEEIDLVDRLEEVADGIEGVVFDRPELDDFLSRSGIRAERVLTVPVADHGFLLATSTESIAFGPLERTPIEAVAGAGATALDVLERSAAIRTCQADLDRLEAVVDRCRRVHEIGRTLLESDTRAEIERRLCDALVSFEFAEAPGRIELAWIGDVATGAERIGPDTWAGRNGEHLEPVRATGEDGPDHPATTAVETLEPVIVEDVAVGVDDHEWRRRVLERGFRSVLSVPLVADEFAYGVLTVYADRPAAVDGPVREVCEHLAAVATAAIAAVERKRALLAERVTELEVVLRDRDEPLSAVANELGRRLDVGTIVPRSSGGSTAFCTVADVDEASIHEAVESLPSVESGRLVGDRSAESTVELVFAERTVGETLADHGGVLRSVDPVDERTRLVVDLSSTVDVGSFLRALERRHPGTDLVARRERDRPVRSARPFDAELRSQLSERQLRTLEAAYHGGFFEWPRESTGEDVADSLGVSQPTFSRHLRLAQGKLFASLFDDRPDEE